MSGPLVLVADDDGDIRTWLHVLLAHGGFTVASAGDGLECLLKVRQLHPAALLLDIMMPDVGGLRVLDQLAAEHAELPVLVLTGRSDAAAACRERLGRENVFDKPPDSAELLARLHAVTEAPGA